jgi:hypothetical protein
VTTTLTRDGSSRDISKLHTVREEVSQDAQESLVRRLDVEVDEAPSADPFGKL